MKTKITLSISAMLVICFTMQAQFYREGSSSDYYSIRNAYIQGHPGNGFSGFGEDTSEGGEFTQFQRWQWFWGPRLYPHGNFQVAVQATQDYVDNYNQSNKISQVLSPNWTELGPSSNTNPSMRGIGRIISIAFDPVDPVNIMYAGGTVGGVWKTTDGGQNWLNLNTDLQLARLGVSTITIDPVPNTNGFYNIYVGTGEVGAPYSFSDGVYRSQDGGQTWQAINSGLFNSQTGYYYVPKLLVDPSNNGVLYAATSVGVFKCTNRQAANPSWSQIYPLSGTEWMRNILFEPGNPQTVYASGVDIVRSTDGGSNWSFIARGSGLDLSGTPTAPAQFPLSGNNDNYMQNINIAISGDNQYLYASMMTRFDPPPFNWNTGSTSYLFRYNIQTNIWEQKTATPNGRMPITVHPSNNQVVFVADVFLGRTLDGGLTWPGVGSCAHVDYHVSIFAPYNSNILFVGTDGGIWKLTFAGNTVVACDELTNGLGVSTLYHVSSSPFDPHQILTGTQDMANFYRKNNLWEAQDEMWGDGSETAMDHRDINYMYGTQMPNGGNGRLYRATTNINPNFSTINNVPNSQEGALFGAPLAIDPVSSSTLYQGRINVWKTTDATAAGTPTWTKISDFQNDPNIQAGLYQAASAIAVAPSNPNYIYVAVVEDGPFQPTVFYTQTGGGIGNWQKIPIIFNNRITGIAVSSSNPNHVWITVSGYNAGQKVYRSINGGLSWTNFSGSLPNLPANCIVYQNGSNDGIYVGTDVGVYYRDNTLSDWQPYMAGLPNTVVNWLEINYSCKGKIKAATFGRGVWESDLAVPITSAAGVFTISAPTIWSTSITMPYIVDIQSGQSLTISGTSTTISMSPGTKFIVRPGASLIVDGTLTGCDTWDGIEVHPTGLLQMNTGSVVDLNGNGKIFIDGTSTQRGKMIYNSGATIKLMDNNTLAEFKGDLQIGSSAVFSFVGNGYLKFASPPVSPLGNPYLSDNISAGANSKIVLTGSGPTDKVLEITQESLYPPAALTEFRIQNGRVELAGNSRINPFGLPTQVKLIGSVFTSTTGSFNNHRGIHLYGQPSQVDNCTFEYGKYGIFAWLGPGGNPLTINGSTFRFCTTGLYSVDKGVTLNGCSFTNHKDAWTALNMALPSKSEGSVFDQNQAGINYINAAAASNLLVRNSSVSQNQLRGIDFSGPATLTVRCGAVSNNGTLFKDFGIRVSSNGNLNMSSSMVPKGGQVSAFNNKTTITAAGADIFYLDKGYNDLRRASGTGRVMVGSLRNGCLTVLQAKLNRWKNAIQPPTSGIDYLLTTWSCTPQKNITINDPQPFNSNILVPPSCPPSNLLAPPQNPNTNNSMPIDFCPDCPKITSVSFNKVKYNEAVQQTMNLMEIENPSGNDLTAVDMFYQILTQGTDKKLNAKKQEDVAFLNNLAYPKMKEALGNAFLTGRTTDFSESNPSVQQLLTVQDSLIIRAKASGDNFAEFYVTADKALLYRLINQREKTLEQLDGIAACMSPDSLQTEFLSLSRKVVLLEYLVLKGEIQKESFEEMLNGNISGFTSPEGINVTGDTSAAPNGCVNQVVTFRPSVFASSYAWDFGNGGTANIASPSTTYTATGTYTVTLVITTSCASSDTFLQTITIIGKPTAGFTPSLTSGLAPLTVDFTNTSTGEGTLSYFWDFGDGGTDVAQNPSHTYQDTGTYVACLIVTNECGSDTHCIAINVLAEPCISGAWVQKANFGGTPRSGVTTFVIQGKAYMGTGYDDASLYQDFWQYDPQTDVWTQVATFPGAARFVGAGFYFSVGDKGYFGTGWNGTASYDESDFWEYNATLNIWTQKANFAGGQRNGAVGFAIGSKGYICTGWNITDYPIYFHQDVWEYDPQTDTWTQKNDFPGPGRQGGIGFSIGSKGYIGLGGGGSFSNLSTFFNDFWEYDPQTDSWTQKADLPADGRQWPVGFSIGTKGYIGTGGTYPNGPHYADFWEWDQANDTWTQKADFGGGAMNLASGFAIGSNGYVGTGHDGSPRNDFWEFDPNANPCPSQVRIGDNSQQAAETHGSPSAISVYPNPNSGEMIVKYSIPENQQGEFEIYNLIGVKVAGYPLQSGGTSYLNVSQPDLTKGVYTYRIKSNDKMIEQGKIVIIK